MKLPSKRLVVRLAVVSVVVALGGFAVLQARIALKKTSEAGQPGPLNADQKTAENILDQGAEAIPDTQDGARSNPFAGSRLLPASHTAAEAQAPRGPSEFRPADRDPRFGGGGSYLPLAMPSPTVALASVGDGDSPAAAQPGLESPAASDGREARLAMSPGRTPIRPRRPKCLVLATRSILRVRRRQGTGQVDSVARMCCERRFAPRCPCLRALPPERRRDCSGANAADSETGQAVAAG